MKSYQYFVLGILGTMSCVGHIESSFVMEDIKHEYSVVLNWGPPWPILTDKFFMLPGVTLPGFICAGAPLCGAPFLGPYMKGISHDRHNLSCPKRGKKWEEEGKKRGKINLNQINTKRSILGCFWKFRYNHACKRYKGNEQKVFVLTYKTLNTKFVGAKTKPSRRKP